MKNLIIENVKIVTPLGSESSKGDKMRDIYVEPEG